MITGILLAGIAYSDTISAPTIIETKGKATDNLKSTSLQEVQPTVQELKDHLASEVKKYGGNYSQIYNVIMCESGWRINPPHNNISFGIAQFTPATWKDFGQGDIMNPYTQITVMVKMWNKGLEKRWDCFKILN